VYAYSCNIVVVNVGVGLWCLVVDMTGISDIFRRLRFLQTYILETNRWNMYCHIPKSLKCWKMSTC